MMKLLLSAMLFMAGTIVSFAAYQKPILLKAEDNGKIITVRAGQEVVVLLKGNITTGYSWELAGIQGESVVLDGEVKYQNDPKPAGMMGAPGMFTAKLKSLKPGKSTVKLEYRRPWEKDKKPAETFEITLVVEK